MRRSSYGFVAIEIDVNEAYINRVAAGQKVMATLDAYPDWKISCHVIAVIPTADRQRATVEVRVGFDELDSRILPDMGVKVAFQDAARAGEDPDRRLAGVLLPQSAVRRADGRDYVLIVSNGLLERRAVALGDSRGSDAIITSGINPGESVVVKGPAELIDGMRVRERQE